MMHATVYAFPTPPSYLTWIKVLFWDGRRLAHLLGHVVRLLRYGARRAGERAPRLEIIQRQLRTPRPAGRRPRYRWSVHNDKLTAHSTPA